MAKTKKIKKTTSSRTPKKTKKTVIRKTKKVTRKKIIKKPARKLTAKVFLATSSEFKSIQTEINKPAAVIASVPAQKIKNPAITRQSTRISRHVLDLKKDNQTTKKEGSEDPENENQIYQQLLGKFKSKKQGVLKSFNTGFKQAKNSFALAQKTKSKPAKLPEIKPAEILLEQNDCPKPAKTGPIILPKMPKPDLRIGRLMLPSSWAKASLSFIMVCLLVILPFFAFNYYQKLQGKKSDVFAQATQALLHLSIFQKAASAQDLPNAQIQLEESAVNFNQAKSELDDINILAKGLINLIPNINKQFTTANNIMSAGQKISSSAAILADALEKIKINKSIDGLNLTGNLTILQSSLTKILPDLRTATEEIKNISIEELPEEYQEKAIILQANLPQILNNLEYFNSVSDLFLKVLGQDAKKRYLLLFQNNNELRPTGGFIGSYALVDIDRGNITKIDIPGGGPYDLRAGLKANIESPLPLHIINDRWEFQDANWFADIPTSAEKLSFLFEKSGGPTFDGIIFINATFIEQLLNITGPITLPEYQLEINSSNFIDVLQKEVEINYDREANQPKQIIADLTPILINRLLNTKNDQLGQLLNTTLTALNQKEIQFYFTDYDLENFVNQNNWGGKQKNTDNDYLNIVTTNIAGEKTDAKIKQTAFLKVDIQPDGSIINTLTITKTHTGLEGEAFYGVPNLDYLRIYVPKGSELLKAEGFYTVPSEYFIIPNHEVYEKDPDISVIEVTKNIEPLSRTEILSEGNKTVFANWMQVEPGETKTVTLTYKLPFKLNLNPAETSSNLWDTIKNSLHPAQNFDQDAQTYSLSWQKQSGKRDFNIHVDIVFPQQLNYQFIYPNYIQKDHQNFSFTTELDSDKLLGIIFKP